MLVVVLSSTFSSAVGEMTRIPISDGPLRWFQHVKAGPVSDKPGTWQLYIPKAIAEQLSFSWGGRTTTLFFPPLDHDEQASVLLIPLTT